MQYHTKKESNLDNIKISVCITTRNRANYIGETLESIISQAEDRVEIVILDGASTDKTTQVVQCFQKRFPNLVYQCGETNYGVDRDMATCVEMARGEYCWLLSDDDWLRAGALERMLKEVESGYEIYICNATRCSASMQPIKQNFWLSREIKDTVFNLHNKDEFIKYCNQANSIGALFSFWSTTIFRREEWLKTGFNDDFDGSCYAMASTLLSFIKRKCRLKYIQESLILWRDNEFTFSHQGGLVKRFLLDFDGYLKLADKYLDDHIDMRSAFLKVMTREHPWYTVIHVTSYIDNREEWQQFKSKMLKFGYNSKSVEVCYALGRYKNLISLGVKIKRKLVKSSRIQQLIGKFKSLKFKRGKQAVGHRP